MPTLRDLAFWIETRLGREELPALYRGNLADVREVRVLGLALEPDDVPDVGNEPKSGDLDAVFLHRPFRLGARWPTVGVVASHAGFDAKLTTGVNWPLVARLGWRDVRTVAWRGAALGVSATPPETSWPALIAALNAEFSGHDDLLEPRARAVGRVALMNAFRPELVESAARRGVDVCLTGQVRAAAWRRARELGGGVVALGHRRTEAWGLAQLERELRRAFPDLETRLYSSLSG